MKTKLALVALLTSFTALPSLALEYDWPNKTHGCVVSNAGYAEQDVTGSGRWSNAPTTFFISLHSCDQYVRRADANPFAVTECKQMQDPAKSYLLKTKKLRDYDEAWDIVTEWTLNDEIPVRARGYESGLLIFRAGGTVNYISSGSLDGGANNAAWFMLQADCTPLVE